MAGPNSLDAVNLSPTLPCLVLTGQVLLPTSFVRIAFNTASSRSTALLEHLSSTNSTNVYVAVLSASRDDEQDGPSRALSQKHVGSIATAARVLQLSRIVQTGDWVLLLEGVCRVLINDVMISDDPTEEYDCVAITQLELRPPGAPVPITGSAGPYTSPDHAPDIQTLSPPGSLTGSGSVGGGGTNGADLSVLELGRQLKTTTRALLRQLTRNTSAPQSRRMLEVLGSVPAWRAADVVAAALATTYQERLAVLHAVDHRLRIRLALALAQGTLDALRAGSPLGGTAGSSGPVPSWANKPGLRAPARPGNQIPGAGTPDPSPSSADGAPEDDSDGLDAVLARLAAAKPPPEVAKAAAKEYKKLRQAGEHQPGYAAARSYLETLADLPWSRSSADVAAAARNGGADGAGASDGGAPASPQGATLEAPMRLGAARQVLDKQHFGLEKIKDRVIEYLAVMRLKGSSTRAPILCFIGPPGVGKTSLARSVSEVLGRPFVRIALGGVRDEAEIRGHRRTYVGAMPGRIINGLKRAGVNDPVMLLDELDKLGKDAIRGDPAAALLEVLDPEQNSHFTDAYLSIPCDLSRITFVATANRASDIPAPLLDRLEVISLGGYTLEEKIHIAQQHLLPKTLADHGLNAQHVRVDAQVIEFVTDRYTREAGVRNLSRCLAALCRHIAVSIVSQHEAQDPNNNSNNNGGTPALLTDAGVAGADTTAPGADAPAGLAAGSPAGAAAHGEAQMGSVLHPLADGGVGGAGGAGAGAPPHLASLADLAEAPLHPFLPSTLFAQPTGNHTHAQQPTPASSPHDTHTSHQQVVGHTNGSNGTKQGGSWLFPWQRGGSHTNTHEASHTNHTSHNNVAPGHASGAGRRVGMEAGDVSNGLLVPECGGQAAFGPLDVNVQGVITVTERMVEDVLGPPRFNGPAEASEAVTLPGAAAGLVWTAVGGSVQYIECARISYGTHGRHGHLTLTGQVGEVLEESARIALSWIRANASALGLPPLRGPNTRHDQNNNNTQQATQQGTEDDDPLALTHETVIVHKRRNGAAPAAGEDAEDDDGDAAPRTAAAGAHMGPLSLQPCAAAASALSAAQATSRGNTNGCGVPTSPLCWDVHIHLPAGAIPKDGPSAGITLVTALASLMTDRVVRADTAMTGEVTLRGLVLPVGGIKEKLLAARHAGMKRVIVPARNMRDVIADVPPATRDALTIIPAERLEQVLAAAFDPPFALLPPPTLTAKL